MTALSTRSDAWSTRTFWSLIGALVTLGVVLLALNGPFSSIRNLLLVMFVTQVLPLVIAVLVYSRIHPTASPVELIGVVLWGYLGISLAGVFGYFAFVGMASSYPGPTQEMVNNIIRFLLTTAVIGGLYAVAASVRERPLVTGGVLLLVPVGLFLLYAVI